MLPKPGITCAPLERALSRVTARREHHLLQKLGLDGHPPAASIASACEQLRPLYETYVSTISSPDMAVSLRTAALLLCLCRARQPRQVLDTGSGFSSYVVRLYARDARTECTACSVETDVHWLEQTRRFLSDQGMDSSGVLDWESFEKSETPGFDLIFHDIAGAMTLRPQTLPYVLSRLNDNGVVVLDDFHKILYRWQAGAIVRQSGRRCVSLRHHTLDDLNRFAAVGFGR